MSSQDRRSQPFSKPDTTPGSKEAAVQLTYLGTNSLLIRKSGSTVMVDPHFSRPRLRELIRKVSPNTQTIAAELDRNGVDHMDGVLLTHTHYDHALDAPEVLRQVGGALYGCDSARNLVDHSGFENLGYVQITPGTAYQVGAFQVIFHPSRHLPFPAPINWLMSMDGQITQGLKPPAWFWDYRCGTVSAIQVDRTLIFGSAGYEKGAYRHLDIDHVVLGIGGLDLKPKSYLHLLYQEAVLLSGAKSVYLSHWDNFFQPVEKNLTAHVLARQTIQRVKQLGRHHGQSIHLLNYGVAISI